MKNKKGFTLIEILVVILIIGVLAAIALPQYKLAIDKVEFTKYKSMVETINKCYYEYFMIHGESPSSFSQLSLTFPDVFEIVYSNTIGNCVQNNEMFCCIVRSGTYRHGTVNCGKKDLSIMSFARLSWLDEIRQPIYFCYADKDNIRANRLCEKLGKKGNIAQVMTPKGYSEYIYQSYNIRKDTPI